MKRDVLLQTVVFNSAPSKSMHIDLNSCFASVEQQANPFLRNKPIAVAAYDSPNGCILAASVDAKRYGIKTGMRVKDGKLLYPELIVMEPDPPKYRYVHKKLSVLLANYTEDIEPKSIDEFILNFDHHISYNQGLNNIAAEIKQRIKQEIGDYLTVSVGIAPNRFLAKTGSNLKKPDGLDEIDSTNYMSIYEKLRLMDLCGINTQNAARLNRVGVYTVLDFYNAAPKKLCLAFESKLGYYWHLRLRGFEVDNTEWDTKTIGHSYSLPIKVKTIKELTPILQKLCEKIARRLRKKNLIAKGIHIAIHYREHNYWHKGMKVSDSIFEASTVFKYSLKLLNESPTKYGELIIRTIYITTYNLEPNNRMQLELFSDLTKKRTLAKAMDKIAEKYGEFTLTQANMLPPNSLKQALNNRELVPDRIAFGKLKEIF